MMILFEAKNHIGETATVCGVASVHYAATSRGNPTFVNLDKLYANQPFTILIWDEGFGQIQPRAHLMEREACVCDRHDHIISG